MCSPLLVATDIINCFDRKQTPEETDGKGGYWWFAGMQSNSSRCTLHMNIRDFDKKCCEARKKYVQSVVDFVRIRHNRAKINVKFTDVYGNIVESLGKTVPPLISCTRLRMPSAWNRRPLPCAEEPTAPHFPPKGLVTPNYFTGGLNFHSNAEFLPVPSLCKSLEMTLKILELAVKKSGR